MRMKSFCKLALASSILFSGIAQAAAGCLDDIRAAGKLRVGVGVMGLKPWIWQQDDGAYTGLENEILEFVANDMGLEYEYVITEWTTLIPGLKAERWDIVMSGMGKTEQRVAEGKISFSDFYFMYHDRIVVKKDSPIQNIEDLKGKTLASTMGSNDSLVAHSLVERGVADKVMDYNNFGEPFVALRNGQVDGVVMDQAVLVAQMSEMDDLRIVGEPLYFVPSAEWAEVQNKADYRLGSTGVALRPECDDLRIAFNSGLKKLDEQGERQKILSKYGLWDESQTSFTK
jgi:ABC-type amino acid transport substrate-binding protein